MRMASCHPDKEHAGKGLCKACYEKQRIRGPNRKSYKGGIRVENVEAYARYKVKHRADARTLALRYKKAAFELLGNTCCICGFTDWRALQIDHIYGGGLQEIRSAGHSTYIRFKRVLDNPENYQLVCANCNWIKRYENNEGAR